MSICDLWYSENRARWRQAVARYWSHPSVIRNIELETLMAGLNPEWVRNLHEHEWYNFLHDKYFPWKYTACNRLAATRAHLMQYQPNRLGELFAIKQGLFAFHLADVREGLRIAQCVNGLGPAGASGLLAVLFPKYFGTVDQFVVRTLAQVQSLAERPQILQMQPENLGLNDAILLISIMRRKANELNALFGTDEWTPRKIDMILWALRE